MKRWVYYTFLLGFLYANAIEVFAVTFTMDADIWDGNYAFINVEDTASVHMYGGTSSNFNIIDSGEFYFHDGRLVTGVDGSMIGDVEDQGKYYQYGGSNYSLRLTENAGAFLYGGRLDSVRLYDSSYIYLYSEIEKLTAYEYSQAHVFGYDFQYTQSNVQDPTLPYGYTWSRLRIFENIDITEYYDIKLLDHLPTTNLPYELRTISRVQFHIIPEPATLSFLALGAFWAGRRRRK